MRVQNFSQIDYRQIVLAFRFPAKPRISKIFIFKDLRLVGQSGAAAYTITVWDNEISRNVPFANVA